MVGHTGYAVDSEDLSQSTNATLSLVKQKKETGVSIANLESIQEEARCQKQTKREKQKKEEMATMNHLAPQEYEELLCELQKISEMDATNKDGVGSEHTE